MFLEKNNLIAKCERRFVFGLALRGSQDQVPQLGALLPTFFGGGFPLLKTTAEKERLPFWEVLRWLPCWVLLLGWLEGEAKRKAEASWFGLYNKTRAYMFASRWWF